MSTLKKAQIAQIRSLRANETGKYFVIVVLNDGTEIPRSLNAFAQDLHNSGHLVGAASPSEIKTDAHPAISRAKRVFVGGYLTGNWEFYAAGSTYVIEDGHPALTDKAHPLFGKVRVGSEVARKRDSFVVDLNSPFALSACESSYRAEAYHDEAINKSVFNTVLIDNRTQTEPQAAPKEVIDEAERAIENKTAPETKASRRRRGAKIEE